MGLILNDASGIKSKSAFNAIKAKAHPVLGRLKRGIDANAALKIETLSLHNCDEIEDLNFLRFLPNLKSLHVHSKNLSDVSGLRHLTKATGITLESDWRGGVDISALSNCRELEELEIYPTITSADDEPHISASGRGWSTLRDLPGLQLLDIGDMGVSDISFLRHLTLLEDVCLAGNPITDLTPLQGHPTLSEIDLSSCGIDDISVLATIPNIRHLALAENRIKDFSPLREMKNLISVDAHGNGLSQAEIAKWESELQHIEDLCFEDEDCED